MAKHFERNREIISLEESWLATALHDVPLPDGLAERLKSKIRLKLEQTSEAGAQARLEQYVPLQPMALEMAEHISGSSAHGVAADQSVSTPAASAPLSTTLPHMSSPAATLPYTSHSMTMQDRVDSEPGGDSTSASAEAGWLRRSFIVLALAAGISGFALLANRWTRPAEPRWLAGQCDAILVQLEKDNLADWQRLDQTAPKLPPSVASQLTRIGFIAQRPLAAISSKMTGMLYRLDAGDGRGIVLFKLQRLPAVRGLTSRFEILSTPSGGWSLAAMTIGNETYVLAGACTEQQLFSYIHRQALT